MGWAIFINARMVSAEFATIDEAWAEAFRGGMQDSSRLKCSEGYAIRQTPRPDRPAVLPFPPSDSPR